MDDARFDHFAKRFAVRLSRRRTLPALVAGLAGLSGLVPPPRAGARPRDAHRADCNGVGRKCGIGHPCCPGQGLICRRHRCRRQSCLLGANGMPCGEGGLCCGGICEHVGTDPFNCGACNHACPAGDRCLGGQCVSQCLGGLATCNGQCVDVLRDPANCGGCGITCSGAASGCVDGQCRCPGGLTLCAGICVDIQTEPAHCGGCGHACPSGNVCQAGTCVSRCKDDGQGCAADAECCRFPESACLNLGVTRVCAPNCVGATSECSNNAVGPRCCAGLSCVGGRCTADVQPPCVPYGQICSSTRPCCDNVPCNGGLCRYN